VGTSAVFRWSSPVLLESGQTPSISFIRPGTGAVLLGPTPLTANGPQDAAVSAVGSDLRDLTMAAPLPADAASITGPDRGRAFLVSDRDGFFPVNVGRASPSSTAVRLNDPLPRKPDAAASISLSWADWYIQLTAADVTASDLRDVLWRVTYAPRRAGVSAPTGDTSGIDEGRLHVVRRPFETGLTDQGLRATFPWLAQLNYHREQGWGETIAAGREVLVLTLRDKLRAVGKWEDDVDGRVLHAAHAYHVAALAVEGQDPERADRLRARADALVELGLRTVWVDLDGDGVVDDGEDAVEITGARRSDAGGTFTSSTLTRRFSIGQDH